MDERDKRGAWILRTLDGNSAEIASSGWSSGGRQRLTYRGYILLYLYQSGQLTPLGPLLSTPSYGPVRQPMGSSQTPLTTSIFDGYYAQLQESALKATKHAAGLPADLAFHRSVDSDLASALGTCSNKVVTITNTLLSLASTVGTSKTSKGKGKARVQDEDDFLDRFRTLIVEPMDQLLENAVRIVSLPLNLALSSYPGYRAGPIFWQDERARHRDQLPRAQEEGGFIKPSCARHTAHTTSPQTAAQVQAKAR
jgi:PMC2NT (NUC016) domain